MRVLNEDLSEHVRCERLIILKQRIMQFGEIICLRRNCPSIIMVSLEKEYDCLQTLSSSTYEQQSKFESWIFVSDFRYISISIVLTLSLYKLNT